MGRTKGKAAAAARERSDDEDYRKKRDRNNQAVKKSRFKSKQKTQETQQRISKLKAENDRLEDDVNKKSSELSLLKELFIAKCANSDMKFTDDDLEKLLEEDPEEKDKRGAATSKK